MLGLNPRVRVHGGCQLDRRGVLSRALWLASRCHRSPLPSAVDCHRACSSQSFGYTSDLLWSGKPEVA